MSSDVDESSVYPCNVEDADSLRIQKRFLSNPMRGLADLEFTITNGKSRQHFPVYMSVASVKEIYDLLGKALHNYHERSDAQGRL